MTGDKTTLVDYKPLPEGFVTFGDGVTTRILGKGTLNVDGFPWFKYVLHVDRLKAMLHVDGLKANLISISQICDINLNVNLYREKCVIIDVEGKCVLEGFRSPDNYYTLTSPFTHMSHDGF